MTPNGGDADEKVAQSLLEDVENAIYGKFGDLAVLSPAMDKARDTGRMLEECKFCQSLLKKVDAAVGACNNSTILCSAAFLRGRVYALYGSKAEYAKAVAAYDEAFGYGMMNPLVAYYRAVAHDAWGPRDLAVADYELVIQLEGAGSDRGLAAGKRIALLKQQKNGGCAGVVIFCLLVPATAIALFLA